jgi:hypothetical protein
MCGIAGILNLKPKKLDYATFTSMGILNDERGGDACGIFIDGDVDYGTAVDDRHFRDYFTKSTVLKEARDKKVNIALVHCRKASVGGVAPEKAQPVVLKDSKGNVRFVMIHNGTVHNYEALAKKYIPDVKIEGLTDSQVLARIFYYKGYECLSEYNGGAAFVTVDYRQPTPLVLMWRGASKKTDVSKEVTEERPLWFVYNKKKAELVFCSIPEILEACRPDETLYRPVENKLVTFRWDDEKPGEAEVYVHASYSRDKCTQTKEYTGTTTYYGGGYSGSYNWGRSSGVSSGVTTTTYRQLCSNMDTNVYGFKTGTEVPHGSYSMSKYGYISSTYSEYDVFFYQGVPLRDKKYFKFLCYLQKRAKMTPENFLKSYENLVRFFSLDRLFVRQGKYYRATKINECELYTGPIQMIGEISTFDIKDGQLDKDSRKTGDYGTPFKQISAPDEIILSKLGNVCKSLMR